MAKYKKNRRWKIGRKRQRETRRERENRLERVNRRRGRMFSVEVRKIEGKCEENTRKSKRGKRLWGT